MKQSKLFHLLFPFIIMSIPWIYLGMIWNELPATIPTHFGVSGQPDAYGSKDQILLVPVINTIIAIGTYFLLRNIYKIDPKRKNNNNIGVMSKIAVMVVVLLSAISILIIYWTLHGKVDGFNIFFCAISLFFAYIGNLLHSIKPNYFAGFRLPWTLESEDNWRKTHQVASKIWFIGGIVLAILSLLINTRILIFVFMGGVLIMTLVPIIYSYKLYRKTELTDQNN